MLDKAPKTWEAIRKQLPLTIKAYNAPWTGRETHTKLDLPNKPPRENQILNAGLGDVIYACEWSDRDVTDGARGFFSIPPCRSMNAIVASERS